MFKNKSIIDIGAGSGYFSLRILAKKPKAILAIDPYLPFYFQYKCLSQHNNLENCHYMPIGIEELNQEALSCDLILNMGILYHRKDPIEHLKQCRCLLNKNGKLILETLIWPSKEPMAFSPKDTYAGMKNTYYLPSIKGIEHW
eukprot:COSAG01_NODE_20774_length_936_cov_1.010753_1_plen_142_part_10